MRLLVGLLACLGSQPWNVLHANTPAPEPPAQPVAAASPAPPAFGQTSSSDSTPLEKALLSHRKT